MIDVIQSIFFHHNGMNMQIKNRRKTGNLQKWEFKQHNFKQPMGQKEIMRKYWEMNNNKNLGDTVMVLRGKFTSINAYAEKQGYQVNNPTLWLKLEKRRTS